MESLKVAQAVSTRRSEVEELGVAEDLELLADFVAYVAIIGVERAEATFEGVDVIEREVGAVERADCV